MVQTNDPARVLLQPLLGRLARRGDFFFTHNPPEQTAGSNPEVKQPIVEKIRNSNQINKTRTFVYFYKITLIICIPVI